jgi:tRNA threonylcarbamoyladenosine biosynthesis protein TsaE
VDIELRSLLVGEGETRAFGRHLGTLLKAGDWVALRGELGAGKTTLVSGVLETLHPGARVRSPTYVLAEVYGGTPPVVHADLHRVGSAREASALALEEIAGPDAITLVEWADRALEAIPSERLDLELRYVPEGGRELRIRPRGARWSSTAREGHFDRERWTNALYPGN